MSLKIRFYCLKFSLFIVSLLIFQLTNAQKKQQPLPSKYAFGELDNLLTQKQGLIGKDYVVLIWEKDDTLVYKKEVGEYKSKTVAPIASCSKWLTAALVMQFVDEGKISLDDPVVNYLPVFEKYMKKYVTIRHCLAHMTGIEDDDKFLKKILQRKKFGSLDEEAEAFAAREIRANAGTDFWYGNVGLNIAAKVLEIVSKRKFDVLIKQKLFVPLGMRQTTFTELDGGLYNPSGGARSTADDYMKFLLMLMNKGKYNGKQILSEESVDEMMKIQTNTSMIRYAPKAAEGFNYALGSWVIEEKDGKAAVLASPGLFGTWPMIDACRGYAYILFVKNFLGEERANAHLEIKELIDEVMKKECK
ncbi:MAG TPA: serine hydrolase domain-containing protein [Chitinophagaceae bacterium]|nr:serine hydrolase domain-containing protein [Chitinophagaceae bacterium]